MRMCRLFIASLAQESGQGAAKVKAWLAAKDETLVASKFAEGAEAGAAEGQAADTGKKK